MTRVALPRRTVLTLAAFFFSGAAALTYEVVWTRALSLVLGSTVYAMSTMLSTFMAGLAIGSYLGGKWSDRAEHRLFYFGLCELGIAVTGILSIPLIYKMPLLYLAIYRQFHLVPGLFFTVQVLLCALVMLLPTILMGATFPLVTRSITESLEEMGRKVGDAYSINTVGSVVGSLAVGFFLIPALGVKGATWIAAAMNVAVGIAMILLSRQSLGKALAATLPCLVLAGLWMGTARAENLFVNFYGMTSETLGKTMDELRESEEKRKKALVFQQEHAEGTLRAYKFADNFILQVGGKIEGTGPRDIGHANLMGYLPAAYRPGAESALVIGLGAGVTLRAIKEHVPRVEVVEIHPGVITAVRDHGLPGLLDGVAAVVNDARNHLLVTDRRYDLISSQPSYPTESGVANLFTLEFLRLAASRLAPSGVYCQWLPEYALSREDIAMMYKTFATVFPQTFVWKVQGTKDLIFVGINSSVQINFPEDAIRARVGRLNLVRLPIDCRLVETPVSLARYAADPSVPLNTDDRPILEFHAVDNLLSGALKNIQG
jgi:spermidine synthase